MTGPLEWDAEEGGVALFSGVWQDCRELCLGLHHQPFESAGSGVLGGLTGGCSTPSDWEEAAHEALKQLERGSCLQWIPMEEFNPHCSLLGQEAGRTQVMEEVSECFWDSFQTGDEGSDSRNWFAGLLPCLQGKNNHEYEDGGQPFRGTLAS